MNLLEKKNLEVKHQVGYKDTPLPDIHSPLLYGCPTWSTTKFQCSCIDAFDRSALRKISRNTCTRHVMNVEVGAIIGCRPPSHLFTDRRLRLFGHIAGRSPQEDHHRAVVGVIQKLPPDWKRLLGRPSHAWLHAVEADLG